MEENDTQSGVLQEENKKSSIMTLFSRNLIIALIVVAVLGIASGYLLANKGLKPGTQITTNTSGSTTKGTVEGSDDLKTFKDPAEGLLKEGGIEGEGQYHLERPGGKSQFVYLTSSIVDLSKYVGKKVKVWGQTQTAQKAGWLMDVGKVEVLE